MYKSLVPKVIFLYAGLLITAICIILFVDIFSLQNDVLELSSIIRDTMEDSCRFVTQETFMIKSNNDYSQVRGNSYSILSKDERYQVSGLFYDSDSYERIMQGYGGTRQPKEYINYLDSQIDSYTKKNNSYQILYSIMNGNNDYASYGITPANLGFTYLDRETLEKVFKWKLTNRLTATAIDSNNPRKRMTILTENGVDYFIKWKGFRIYLDRITIYTDNVNRIQVLHITQPSDWDKYSSLTGLTKAYLNNNGITNNDIRSYKIIYDVRWAFDIGYEGILPLALVYSVINGDSDTTFNLTNRDDLKSVFRGDEYNTELDRQRWDTSAKNVDYNNYREGAMAVNDDYIGLASNVNFTIIH